MYCRRAMHAHFGRVCCRLLTARGEEMNAELLEFTRRALEKGVTRDQLARALKQAGWREADIKAASSAYETTDFPLPVPKPRPYLSAREVFNYALLFTALYVSAWNLGSLVFTLVDLYFPDPQLAAGGAGAFRGSVSGQYLLNTIRSNIAAIVVAFPVFLLMFRSINAEIAKEPTKRDSRPRKWLTYLTLFVASALLIGDLSVLVYNVLGGDLPVRFMLKIATVAVIAGGAFTYFLMDIRKDEAP